tara:strand:- start:702 stop:974 length:273 start_codon:yes stop_codon:yes gene_type:complete
MISSHCIDGYSSYPKPFHLDRENVVGLEDIIILIDQVTGEDDRSWNIAQSLIDEIPQSGGRRQIVWRQSMIGQDIIKPNRSAAKMQVTDK